MKHLQYYFKDTYQYKIQTMPEPSLGIVVAIPCFNEPNLSASLKALAACKQPNCGVEVVVLINFGEQQTEEVKANCLQNYNDAICLKEELARDGFTIYPVLTEDIPAKHAGVGLARKTAMDEAAFRFMTINKPKGIIACFDADALCDTDYFIAVEQHYRQNLEQQASSVYYEHPITGSEYSEAIYKGIAQYELHLRYYNQATRHINLPFAFHTVGSSMICTAEAYTKVGGMNKRKAGEDFYFLQKIIPHGHFGEINTTRVIPSPRISNRVPFGTGRAMMKYIETESDEMLTYNLNAFLIIDPLIKALPDFYDSELQTITNIILALHPSLQKYLLVNDFTAALQQIKVNSSNYTNFEKRFFVWFDAFRTLKLMNWLHDQGYFIKQPVTHEALKLLDLLGKTNNYSSLNGTLSLYRNIERTE